MKHRSTVRISIWVAFLIFSTVSFSFSAETPVNLVDSARDLYFDGKYAEALGIAQKALAELD
jgi:hypothetical protein